MTEPDPIFEALRALPSPPLDARVRADALRAGEAALGGAPREGAIARAWSNAFLLPAVLLACEAVYVAHVVSVLRVVFG